MEAEWWMVQLGSILNEFLKCVIMLVCSVFESESSLYSVCQKKMFSFKFFI